MGTPFTNSAATATSVGAASCIPSPINSDSSYFQPFTASAFTLTPSPPLGSSAARSWFVALMPYLPPASFESTLVSLASLLPQLRYHKFTFHNLCQDVPLLRLYKVNPTLVNLIHQQPEIHVPPLQNIIRNSHLQFSLLVPLLVHHKPFRHCLRKPKLKILNKILQIHQIRQIVTPRVKPINVNLVTQVQCLQSPSNPVL